MCVRKEWFQGILDLMLVRIWIYDNDNVLWVGGGS